MSAPQDGGPAFPFVEPVTECSVSTGMTLRDWFAGQAVSGLLACPKIDPKAMPKDYAKAAYGVAEAMLAERAKAEGRS